MLPVAGTWTSIQISHVVRAQGLGPPSAAFPDSLAESWSGDGIAGLGPALNTGYGQHTPQLSLYVTAAARHTVPEAAEGAPKHMCPCHSHGTQGWSFWLRLQPRPALAAGVFGE